jgi:orotate phosphoribosyltransferase-like protein
MTIGNIQERLNISLNAAQQFISQHKIKTSTTDEVIDYYCINQSDIFYKLVRK